MSSTKKISPKQWPKPQFWWLQTGGWLLYPIFIYIAYTPTQHHPNWTHLTIYYVWESVLGFSLTLVLREIWKKLWDSALWIAVSISVIAVAIVAEIWTLGKLALYYQYFEFIRVDSFWKTSSEWYPNSLTVIAAWSAIYFGFRYRNTFIERENSLIAAQAAAKDAQLRMLRYQLNPHFLFNTLANICALISEGETKRAKNMTVELSEFLRYSLDKDPCQTNSIIEEIEMINLYFDIEKIRYAKRLNYEINIEAEIEACQIPSMLLQPLVENAIKYAIAPSLQGGMICIDIVSNKNLLILSVKDNGSGLVKEPSSSNNQRQGIGLQNTRERLKSFYGDQQKLELINIEPTGLEVRITIPMSTTPENTNDRIT